MRIPTRVAVLVAAAWMCGCVADPGDFADWTIPVPEGVPVLEHSYVPISERAGQVLELERELVLTENVDDPDYTFYRPGGAIVGPDGRIFVPDTGNQRIQVFAADSRFSKTIGGEGEGPGEFEGLDNILIAGDNLWAYDDVRIRFSFFDLAGRFLENGQMWEDYPFFQRVEGLDDETAVVAYQRWRPERAYVLARVDVEGNVLEPFVVLRDETPAPDDDGPYVIGIAREPTITGSPGGNVYITSADEYQVQRYGPDGQMLWALRVDWPRDPVDEAVIADALERNEHISADEAEQITWPTHMPAVRRIGSDGFGNLYVFPRDPQGQDGEGTTVDIYSPDGERLFAGFMNVSYWDSKSGPYLYSLFYRREDLETAVVARYAVPPLLR